MTAHLLVLGLDLNDALDYAVQSRRITEKRKQGATVILTWPGGFKRITDQTFDHLYVSSGVIAYEVQARRDTWIAACRTRIRGADGLIPSQRIAQEQDMRHG